MFARVAWGEPYRGCSASFAAKELLTATWREKIAHGWQAPEGAQAAHIEREGLIIERDIEEILALLA